MTSLKGDQQEAFAKDSHLVQQAWEDYFKAHSPTSIMRAHGIWSFLGHDHICWPSWLQMFWNPRELDQVRRLTGHKWYVEGSTEGPAVFLNCIANGITQSHGPGRHSPLRCYFASMTFCPWCGKEGQNKGTIVNHLQAMHYRLGLVC